MMGVDQAEIQCILFNLMNKNLANLDLKENAFVWEKKIHKNAQT